ncbi:MAG TPA: APC family permease [Gemmatimonadaceae bacterium]|nr:APC family permease [Gemmatimonadaceae bacterium]
MKLTRSLTTLTLVFVMYFNTSGGAFTTEALVAEVGPGLALLILLLVPLFYSLPETLIVGELASMLPEEGGYYRWVRRAFGPFWAFQNGWCTWVYSLVDMALYPVLFNQYLGYFFPALGGPARWAVSLAVIWGATAINLRGALRVGRVSVAAGAAVLLAFAALAFAALPHATHAPWHPFAAAGESTSQGLGVGLSIALWNYIGWDNASTVQGEVVDATHSYPRALAFALPLVMLGYFVPLLPALAASDWTQWREGGWPDIARMSGGALGPAIAPLVAVAGLVSALALFNALLMAYSRIPLAMADDGLLPAPLARTDARGTPRNAVLVSAVAYSAFALLPFRGLVVADVLLYSLALALEFGALVALRRREPTLRGAFRIPLGTAGVVALTLLPAATLGAVVVLSISGGEYGPRAIASSLAAAALGVPLYFALARGVGVRRTA